MQIASGVVESLQLETEDCPVGHHRDLDVDESPLVAMSGCQMVLGSRLGPLDRPAGFPGQQGQGSHLLIGVDLDAEATPDVLNVELELVEAHSQGGLDHRRSKCGELGVGDDLDHVRPRVPVDDGRIALDGSRGEAVEVEPVDLHDVIGVLQGPIDVSPVEHALPADVVPEAFV